MKKLLTGKKGFTLIELMIVVAIMGILFAIVVPAYVTYVQNKKFTAIEVKISNGASLLQEERDWFEEFKQSSQYEYLMEKRAETDEEFAGQEESTASNSRRRYAGQDRSTTSDFERRYEVSQVIDAADSAVRSVALDDDLSQLYWDAAKSNFYTQGELDNMLYKMKVKQLSRIASRGTQQSTSSFNEEKAAEKTFAVPENEVPKFRTDNNEPNVYKPAEF